MKTKLLNKIRERFTIEYYPLGVPNGSDSYFDAKYLLKDSHDFSSEYDLCSTKTQAINIILEKIRNEYKDYSIKPKTKQQQNKPIKVWWNGNS